jgi:hypothetical protein
MNKQELIKHFEEMEYVSVSQMGKKAFIDLIEQLDEPQKVTVPKFVADWICYLKGLNYGLHYGLANDSDEVLEWLCVDKLKRQELFARAWLDGYEVEKENRYLVKMKGVDSRTKYLYYGMGSKSWLFKTKLIDGLFRKSHTRKQLEEAGFGDVFNSPLFEVEEVLE